MEIFFAKADQIFELVSRHSPYWVYLFVLFSMVIENLIPPYPGDTVMFVAGVYAASGHASWILIYIISIVGTIASAMVLYYLGRSKGREVFKSSKVKWLGVRKLEKVEKWFSRWGEKLLLLSRWLSGVRALLALFAGVGKVPANKMLIYTLISTITWNFAVLYLALRLRHDWQKVDAISGIYGRVILLALGVVGLILLVRTIYVKKKGTIT